MQQLARSSDPWSTADICDWLGDDAEYLDAFSPLKHFSRKQKFCGVIRTVQCFEDNSLLKDVLTTDGTGCVLVVDGGGSMRRALVGDMMAGLALANKWEGFVINGVVRDVAELAAMDVGVVALGTNPRKCDRRGVGVSGLAVRLLGATFVPGHFVYVDRDGIVLTKTAVVPPPNTQSKL